MNKFKLIIALIAVAAVTTFSACGGGSGSAGDNPGATKSSSKEITAFRFNALAVDCDIDESLSTISTEVTRDIERNGLVPTIEFNGASVSPESGTAQDFSEAVVYTVRAEDGTTKKYSVTVNFRKGRIIFHANAEDAAGTMAEISYEEGVSVTLPRNSFVRSGFSFNGWLVDPAAVPVYNDQDSLQMPANDINLYVCWQIDNLDSIYDYTEHTDEVIITDFKLKTNDSIYSADMKNVRIPSHINGKPVTELDKHSFYYNHYESDVEITSIVIPDTVRTIGEAAFKYNKNFTSLIIPDSVETIGIEAFRGCTALSSVSFGKNVCSVGGGIFTSCSSLDMNQVTIVPDNHSLVNENGVFFNSDKTVLMEYYYLLENKNYRVPESVTTIQKNAFYETANLESVHLGRAVTFIGESAFCYSPNLTGFQIDARTPPPMEPYVLNHTHDTLKILVPAGCLNDYQNADKWTQYKDYMIEQISRDPIINFDAGYSSVTGSMSLITASADSLVVLSPNTFVRDGYTFLGWALVNRGSVKYQDGDSFQMPTYDSTLYACWQNNNASPASYFIFSNYGSYQELYNTNTNITVSDVIIPEYYNGLPVRKIARNAFRGSGITRLTLPETLSTLDADATAYCNTLTEVVIPGIITTIEAGALEKLANLTTIQIAAEHPLYTSLDGVLYSKDMMSLICFPSGKNGAYLVPEGVENIAGANFLSDKVSSVTLPGSVTTIGSHVFRNCEDLEYVEILATTPPTFSHISFFNNSFNSNKSGFKIRVPAASLDAYKNATETGWADLSDIIVGQ